MAVYPERRNGRLTGVWIAECIQHGERRRKRFATKYEGDRWVDFATADTAAAPAQAPTAPQHTLRTVMVEALAAHPGWQRDGDKSRQPRLDYALEFLGPDKPIGDVTTADLDRLVASLRKRPGQKGHKLATGTINRYLANISTLLTFAGRRSYTKSNIHVPWQDEDGQRIHWLTEEAQTALGAELLRLGGKHAELTMRVLCATGMRWGELNTLVPAQVVGTWVKLDRTKTNTPRDIPIEPDMAAELREMLVTKRLPSYGQMRRMLIVALEAAGLDPGITIHCLRHTTASRLVQAEVNLAVVQKFMGHSDIKTTLKYTHLTEQSLQDALKKVSPRAGRTGEATP